MSRVVRTADTLPAAVPQRRARPHPPAHQVSDPSSSLLGPGNSDAAVKAVWFPDHGPSMPRTFPSRFASHSHRRRRTIIAIHKTVRATLAATGCAALLAAGASACGTVQQLTAGEKVQAAFQKLGDSHSATIELSLAASAKQVQSFAKATGEPIELKDAQTVAGLRFNVAMSADKALKDIKTKKSASTLADFPADMGYSLISNGNTVGELRLVDGTMYAHVDVDAVAKLAGEDAGELHASAADMPPELHVFKALLDGKWLSVDSELFHSFANDLPGGQEAAVPSPLPSLDPATAEKLVDSLGDAFSKNATIEDKGQQDGADRIVVSVPARALVGDLQKALKPLAKDIPGLEGMPTSVPTEVPNRKISAELLIKDGALASASFDLGQLQEKVTADAHLPLKVSFATDAAPLKAPTGAVALQQKDIDGFMNLGMGGGGFAENGLTDEG